MRVSLLSDHALVIEYDERLSPLIGAWVPSQAQPLSAGAAVLVGAWIRISRDDDVQAPAPSMTPTLSLDGVSATFLTADAVRLTAPSGASAAIDLSALDARVQSPAVAPDMGALLTIASALLLNRMGAALVHAGAVVDSAGRAWVIAGDTHAGKTTTCITLVSAGWRYLADDQVVLRRASGSDAIVVEGWPRTAHVDEGWGGSRVTSVRNDMDMRARWPGQWIASAPLGGVILPNVQPDSPTFASPVSAGASLAGLIRQSPWLMADAVAAPTVLALLSAASALPAYSLRHGLDTYGQGAALRRLVEAAILAR